MRLPPDNLCFWQAFGASHPLIKASDLGQGLFCCVIHSSMPERNSTKYPRQAIALAAAACRGHIFQLFSAAMHLKFSIITAFVRTQ